MWETGGGSNRRLIGGALFTRFRSNWTVLMTAFAILLLAACSSDSGGSARPTAAPSPTPTATSEPTATTQLLSEDFATAEIPLPDPVRLAKLKEMLSLVPADYGSAVHLDLKALREDPTLSAAITPETLGLETALPPLINQVLDGLVLAVDAESDAVISGFNGPFQIGELLGLAGGFGVQLGDAEPEDYRGHQVWIIEFLGLSIAMGSANDSTGVAGSGAPPIEPAAVVKQSLDAFDQEIPRLLDGADANRLLENLPSGFVAVVIADCGNLTLFAEIQGLPGCTGAVITADLADEETAVFHVLVGLGNESLAAEAVELARGALEAEASSDAIQEVGVRQEGDLVRARVVAPLPQFEDTFRLFTPR